MGPYVWSAPAAHEQLRRVADASDPGEVDARIEDRDVVPPVVVEVGHDHYGQPRPDGPLDEPRRPPKPSVSEAHELVDRALVEPVLRRVPRLPDRPLGNQRIVKPVSVQIRCCGDVAVSIVNYVALEPVEPLRRCRRCKDERYGNDARGQGQATGCVAMLRFAPCGLILPAAAGSNTVVPADSWTPRRTAGAVCVSSLFAVN